MSELSKNYYMTIVKAMQMSNDYARRFYAYDENSTREHFYSRIVPIIEDSLKDQPNLLKEDKNKIIDDYLEKMILEEKERRITGRSSIIIKLEEIIHKTLQDNGIIIEPLPYFAELPTGQLNAKIIKVPNSNEYLILFENQIFVFILLLAKVIALSLPIVNDENNQPVISLDENLISNHLYHNPEPIQRFYELISAYIITGMVNNAPNYSVSYEVNMTAQYFINSMELFVLAHEYGHVLNGHLGDYNSKENPLILKSTLGREPINEVQFNWGQEWEADLTGTKIAIASSTLTGVNPDLVNASIHLFFLGLSYLDRAKSIFLKDEYNPEDRRVIVNSTTHPPPAMRLSNIAITKAITKDTSGITDIVTKILNTLWDEIEPKLMNLKKGMNS